MTTLSGVSALLLARATAATGDTLLVRPLPPIRTPFEQLVFVASGLTWIFALVFIVGLVLALILTLLWVRAAAKAATTAAAPIATTELRAWFLTSKPPRRPARARPPIIRPAVREIPSSRPAA